MAYLRGDNYIWADDANRLHIWASEGADTWEDSGWATDGKTRHPDRQNASGVAIPQRVLDEYVVMRFAELIESREMAKLVERAASSGNFGADALKRRADAVKRAIELLESWLS